MTAMILGSLRGVSPELLALQKRADQCVARLPFTMTRLGDYSVCNDEITRGMRWIEKLTFLDTADNATVFDTALTLLAGWYNTGLDGKTTGSEAEVRRIAAQKLGEPAVFDAVSPTIAVFRLAAAGRREPSGAVKLAIVRSLYTLLRSRSIPDAARTEAMTTLRILADPYTQDDVYVLNAANDALKALARSTEPKPPSPPASDSVPEPSFLARHALPLTIVGLAAVLVFIGATRVHTSHSGTRVS
jgi:hypothetical protein